MHTLSFSAPVYEEIMSSDEVEFLQFLCPINANPGKFRVPGGRGESAAHLN